MTSASYFHARGRRSTHSRATHQRARQHRSSVRFDWTHCRPLGAFACGAVSIALLANACQSFATSDDLSMILFGVSSLPFGALCGWFLAPAEPSRKAVEEARKAEERREHQRRWSAAAARVEHLKAERARLQKAKKSYAHVQAELSALTHAMLRGEV